LNVLFDQFMNAPQQVTVFDDADLIREAITVFCRDKLPRLAPGSEDIRAMDSAIDALCWDAFPLQGKYFPYQTLVDKCGAILSRSNYLPLKTVSPKDLANEISTPMGGW